MGKFRHGLYGTPTYESWSNMKSRCSKKSEKKKHYHNRNINCCERWSQFLNFLEDMGERPQGTTLERINNDAGYSKGNCRWATRLEQANNRTTSRYVEYDGKRDTLANFCRIYGLDYKRTHNRLNKLGWNIDRVIKEKTAIKR